MSEQLAEARSVLDAGTWSDKPVDRVVLAYDDRHRRRFVLTCASGRQILLNLADARVLADGDGLQLGDGAIIVVEAAPEKLIEVRAADAHELIRIAWHLGNRHLPTEILADSLRIRHDHVIEAMVIQLGAKVEHINVPFNPEGGAYGHGHVEGHDHSDD
jgi:urease accessory protein